MRKRHIMPRILPLLLIVLVFAVPLMAMGEDTGILARDRKAPTVSTNNLKTIISKVPIKPTIVVTFSESVKKGTNFRKIALKTTKGASVGITTSLSGKKLTIKTKSNLAYKTQYVLNIPAKAVKDTAGNNLAKNYSLKFTTIQEPGTVTLVSFGGTVGLYNSYGDFYEVSAAVVVYNSDKTKAATDVRVMINFSDESGRILKTETGYISYIPPNSKAIYASDVFVDGTTPPSQIQAFVENGGWDARGLEIPSFSFEDLNYQNDEYFPKVNGVITNPYDRSVEFVKVCVALYDDQNKIIGGGYTYVDYIPPNGQAQFSVLVGIVENLPVARIEAFASLGFDDPYQ